MHGAKVKKKLWWVFVTVTTVSTVSVRSVPLSAANCTPTFSSVSLASSYWRAPVPFWRAWLTSMAIPVDSRRSWWRHETTDVLPIPPKCNRSFYPLVPTELTKKRHIAVVNTLDFLLPPQCQWDLRSLGDFTQRRMVLSYWRFGATCRSHRQGSSTGVGLPSV
jgi:hypothetical protein